MPKETIKIDCAVCGGGLRNHRVLFEKKVYWGDDSVSGSGRYQMCQCLGCESIRLREVSWCSEEPEETIRVYPEHAEQKYKPIEGHEEFPVAVGRMYSETITVMNAGVRVLAGGGLRSIVEAICKEQAVAGRNLQQQIDQLVNKGILAANQAPLLHEARFLGNESLHELQPPSRRALGLCLRIIEGMLTALYVLPEMAKELQTGRLAKKKAKTP